jgi:hypothetical protein
MMKLSGRGELPVRRAAGGWLDPGKTESSDVDELEEAAASLATANFRERHPDADLMQ